MSSFFGTGGDGTWRDYLTLPNILKEFNPNLVGFAVGSDLLSHFSDNQSHFGMGIPSSHDEDLFNQAQKLVQLIKQHPKVNFNRDWKVRLIYKYELDSLCVCLQSELLASLSRA